jgi:hypothetical protein
MKKIFLINLLLFSFLMKGQNNSSVEKSINSIQIGTVGAWFQNETKLTNTVALRSEVGLYTEIVKDVGFYMAPEITLEPRWYYTIKKRASKNLDISNNSANYFTIKTNFRSSSFEISNFDDKRAENSIAFIPKWGIRRNIGTNFNYELGLGIGYLTYINQKYATLSDSDGLVIDAHIRIGYNF